MTSSRSVGDGAVLAIDQGTTNTKALLVDTATGVVLAQGSSPTSISFPAPGRVEQDAEGLWSATQQAVSACLAAAPGVRVAAIGIANQRETAVCWSRSTGRPLGPALGWQDTRTARWCAELAQVRPGADRLVSDRTGLSLQAMFSAPKFRALLDAAVSDGADPDDLAVGTVDAWLVWNLTGQHLTEYGNASRTLLLDLESLTWDVELLDLFGVPARHLPRLRSSDGDFGLTRSGIPGLPAGVPVLAVLADSHAALYHHGCTLPGSGKATYGTGTSVMSPISRPRPGAHGIATTVAWHVDGVATYALEGNIAASGSALDWMATTLGVPDGTAGGAFLSSLAGTVPDSGGVCFVPAFSGLGAPYWDGDAVGVLTGVTGGTRRGHLARAALEAVAHQVVDVVEDMEKESVPFEALHADGGATGSRLLMQMQADLLGRPVDVATSAAASALGAARLACSRLGRTLPPRDAGARIDPEPAPVGARTAWADAVARSRGLPLPRTSSHHSERTTR